MQVDYGRLTEQLRDMVNNGMFLLNREKPSQFAERRLVMGDPFPGKFSYDLTPYTREIVDCLAPDHPARVISVMKGAQIGLSSGVLLPGLAWIVANSPGNTLFSVGHSDLLDKATEKLDLTLKRAGLSELIKPQILKKRNSNTGDKNQKKDFAGGYIFLFVASNPKVLRDMSIRYGFIDDCEALKGTTRDAGSNVTLLEQRFAAYKEKMKLFWISTPEQKQNSIIEGQYDLGDKRKFMVPCPVCHEPIELLWEIEVEGNRAGITYKLDASGKVDKSSVGYVCQQCAGFFTDKTKQSMLRSGFWKPTATALVDGHYSYHISALYAPTRMFDWYHYATKYVQANPANGTRKEHLHQSFVNVVLGQTYEYEGEAPSAVQIQRNICAYKPWTIPDKTSVNHGNGRIALVTMACDMNGKKDDARLDWEIAAWSQTGASYSVAHGSIGTYRYNDNLPDRQHWSYELNAEFSVWKELERIRKTVLVGETGGKYRIAISGVDVGYLDTFAYSYMDSYRGNDILALRGDKEQQYVSLDKDVRYWRQGKARLNYYLLSVGFIKDDLAEYMKLGWAAGTGNQPPNFMNFPTPEGGLYVYEDYFAHYEAEQKQIVNKKDGGTDFRWVKRAQQFQNHMFDCRVYNMALRELAVYFLGKTLKVEKEFGWPEYCNYVLR